MPCVDSHHHYLADCGSHHGLLTNNSPSHVSSLAVYTSMTQGLNVLHPPPCWSTPASSSRKLILQEPHPPGTSYSRNLILHEPHPPRTSPLRNLLFQEPHPPGINLVLHEPRPPGRNLTLQEPHPPDRNIFLQTGTSSFRNLVLRNLVLHHCSVHTCVMFNMATVVQLSRYDAVFEPVLFSVQIL